MAHATSRRQHPNAPLTVEGRRRMVGCVVDRGWTIEATATRFQIDAKTVRKWPGPVCCRTRAGTPGSIVAAAAVSEPDTEASAS